MIAEALGAISYRLLGPPDSLKRKATVAVIWVWLQGALRGLVGVVLTGILARILGATAYGLYAIAFGVFGVGAFLADAGIGAALVQRAEISEEDIRAGHTIAVVQGLAVGVFLALLAYPISLIFQSPHVFPLLLACCVGIPMNSWGVASMALLRRELRHRDTQWCNFAGYLGGQVLVAIPLALLGAGAWALVAGLVAQQFGQSFTLYRLTRHSTVRLFKFDRTSKRFTWSILLQNVAISLLQSLDQLVLGHFHSPAMVGLFNRAKWSYEAPLGFIVTALQTVGLAASAKAQDNAGRLKRISIKLGVAAMSSGLFVALIYACWPRQVIHLILGTRFMEAASILGIIGAERVLWCAISPLGAVLNGAGHPEIEAKSLIVIVPLAVVVFIMTAPHGLHALALGLLGVTSVRLVVQVLAVVVVLRAVGRGQPPLHEGPVSFVLPAEPGLEPEITN